MEMARMINKKQRVAIIGGSAGCVGRSIAMALERTQVFKGEAREKQAEGLEKYWFRSERSLRIKSQKNIKK